jgi:hypothetical protein
LEELAAWLGQRGNEQEFIVVYFDDQDDIGQWGKVGAVVEDIMATFPEVCLCSSPTCNSFGWVLPSTQLIVYLRVQGFVVASQPEHLAHTLLQQTALGGRVPAWHKA